MDKLNKIIKEALQDKKLNESQSCKIPSLLNENLKHTHFISEQFRSLIDSKKPLIQEIKRINDVNLIREARILFDKGILNLPPKCQEYMNTSDFGKYKLKEGKIILEGLEEIAKEDEYLRGLYQAKVGDPIWIGIQGNQAKNRSEISKILPNGRLVDKIGNIWEKNGRLYQGAKSSQFMKKYNPGKEISAQLITQPEYDKEHKNIKVDHLRKFDWGKMSTEELEKIIDQLPIKQGNKLNKSRFIR